MSPEIYIEWEEITLENGKPVPDENGIYQTSHGEIEVDTSEIHATNRTQPLHLSGDLFDGKRTVYLSPKGTGSQILSGGRRLEVQLLKPIRTKTRGELLPWRPSDAPPPPGIGIDGKVV